MCKRIFLTACAVGLAIMSGIAVDVRADWPQAQPEAERARVRPPRAAADRVASALSVGRPLRGRDHPRANAVDIAVGAPVLMADRAGDEASISGHVFYNDQRTYGTFSSRRDDAGNTAASCRGCAEHWLGAYYTVVDVIEADSDDVVGSDTVGSDGGFRVSFPASAQGRDYYLRVRLRFNGEDYAFAVGPGRDDFYALYYYLDDPLRLATGTSTSNRTLYYQRAGTDPDEADAHAIAVNHYASVVDVILALHRDNDVPFGKDDFGLLQVEYPSNGTSKGMTKSASLILLAEKSKFPVGQLVAHEYGHAVHLRAWGGSYGWPGIGYGWTSGRAQEPRVALKEGWANFVAHYALETYTSSDTSGPQGTVEDGYRWIGNVESLFSDWVDDDRDDEAKIAGYGDRFQASLKSTWKNLRDMASHADDWRDGLTVCDYVDYYLYVRKSVANVGREDHERYVELISNLAFNNNIDCGLPHPGSAGKQGFALVKLQSDGSYDESFGDLGYTVTDLAGASDETTGGAALTPAGRIVVAGTAVADGRQCIALLEYTAGGRLAPDFGQGGVVLEPIDRGSGLDINAVHVDGSGAITVAGSLNLGHPQFFVARFDSEGRLREDTFNAGSEHPGWTTIEINSGSKSAAYGVTTDGSEIIVGGYVDLGTLDTRFAVARMHSGGGLKNDFDGDGIQVTNFSSLEDEAGRDVVVHPDGRILVAGSGWKEDGGSSRFAVACYHDDGRLDTGWSSDGKSAPNYDGLQQDFGRALDVDGAGRVVIAGYGGVKASVSSPYNYYDFLVRRYDDEGRYDETFGNDGWVTADFDDEGSAWGRSVVCDDRDKVVVAGHVGVDDNTRFAAARFTTTGAADASFSGDGVVVVDFGAEADAELAKVLLAEDGGIYLIGHTH
ncbi:MAG: hypothetical protein GY838_14965 [bacterium]|nr:hypothetical protein [bacterium]